MKILIFNFEHDYYRRQELWINGKCTSNFSPLNECPEDAIIGRDLKDANDFLSMIQLGHQAGLNGEKLEVEFVEANPDEIYESEQWNDLVARGFVS